MFTRWLFRLILGRRLPQTKGKLTLSGLHSSVQIHRDQWGVPYVQAQNDHDAWFGLGFCHGQDRAFQLDVLTRVAQGRLAEMIGEEALPVDRLTRRVGFHRASEEQVAHLSPEISLILDAYVAGVNSAFEIGKRSHEHALLRSQPLEWTTASVLGLLKLQSFLMAANWDVELARLMILKLDGAQALQDIDPVWEEDSPVVTPVGEKIGTAVDRLTDDLQALEEVVALGGGSNNWAIRSTRTSTGRPSLANDPHLNATIPSSWYLAHVQTPSWRIAGATFAGTPAFPSGHNDVAAWGITAGLGDVTDLFLEEISENGRSVRQGDDFVECEVLEERISVRNAPDAVERVTITPRGPIISPALEGEWDALSMQATWLNPRPIEGLFLLPKVRSFDEFRQALSVWPMGTMNMVYADTHDVIGWQYTGDIPIRRHGWGMIPQPGWNPEVGWEEEPVPAHELPFLQLQDGSQDYLATANNQPTPEGVGPFLGKDWMNGFRQGVILDRLSESRSWDLASTMDLQCNVELRFWPEIRSILLALPRENSNADRALRLLEAWDGRMTTDSAAATVFELFQSQMIIEAIRAKAPKSHRWALGQGCNALAPYNFFSHRRTEQLVHLLKEQPEDWFADQTWTEAMVDVLSAVMEQLTRRFGSDPEHYVWGQLRTLTPKHPFSRKKKWLAKIFNLATIPLAGSTSTVAQATVHPLDPLAEAENTASLRAVMDVGNWSASRFALPGGQSGNPFSPHYGDQYPIWAQGEGISLAWTDAEIAQASCARLELESERRTDHSIENARGDLCTPSHDEK